MKQLNQNDKGKSGFTLTDLLVVIATIAILKAIVFPVFAKVREKARKTACLSNTKRLTLRPIYSIFGILAILNFAASVHAATYWVDVNHGSDAYAGSQAAPWKTLSHAETVVAAGDTVNVQPGTYNETLFLTKRGTPTAYITFQAATSTQPVITSSSVNTIDGNYVAYRTFIGFNVTNTYQDAYGGGNGTDFYNWSSYINVESCTVHDCGSGGICFEGNSDEFNILGNTVYNCAADSAWHASGIDINGRNWADTKSGYHILIENNLVYDNHEDMNYLWPAGANGEGGAHTDGNGIIIDTSAAGGSENWAPPVLIQNNNVWNNGGRGICVTKDNSVTVNANNLAYDLTDTTIEYYSSQDELMAIGSHNTTGY
jgi:serralysin